jgi:hypothetical protein
MGRIIKWIGFGASNSVIGDTSIFEDKLGNVGIGTDAPMSRLTVQGMIETTLGGLKFPDGTVQTTSAAGALFMVAHDATLTGDATASSRLGVNIPLNLTGSVPLALGSLVLTVSNTAPGGGGVGVTGGPGGPAISAAGGADDITGGGIGVSAAGGSPTDAPGGTGVVASGGSSSRQGGGTGVTAFGGDSSSSGGGEAIFARGGQGVAGGVGMVSVGGGGRTGFGGNGVNGLGGSGNGTGFSGGNGIVGVAGFGQNGATDGLAGKFTGNVAVSGNLSKGGGSFKIDHPLDPENKYLYHSFVESPDMMNIYNGNVTTDASGDAVVTLPDWFEALNRDFRYQLTVIGTFAQAIVAEKVNGNHFKIKTNAPNVEVSWQVTGIRQDAYANKHRIPVEETKPEVERGSYLHPDVFDQPDERNVEWARRPELMRRIKQMREKATQPMQ